jgi:hypothetical protein
MKERDVKLLWGRAGGICSFNDCRRKLTEDPTSATDALPLGEHAHIVAESPEGPRGQSVLDDATRAGYTNHILLCPTHHALVDKAPNDYPAEQLHVMKREHELWVEQRLGFQDDKAQAAEEVYGSLIDAAMEACDFHNWNVWTSHVIGSRPTWRDDAATTVYRFGQRIIGAAWPATNPELERALQTLSICMNTAAQRFLAETETRGDERVEVKYYKQRYYEQDVYDRLVDRWEDWNQHMALLITEATKAANWLADVVRRDLNPRFFSVAGKFTLTEPADLSYVTHTPEFTDEQKQQLPDGLDLRQPKSPEDDED